MAYSFFAAATITNSHIKNTKFTNNIFNEANLSNVEFKDINVEGSHFHNATIDGSNIVKQPNFSRMILAIANGLVIILKKQIF
jgi:uncharacterized protein YjbI with pentapeptide repeats